MEVEKPKLEEIKLKADQEEKVGAEPEAAEAS